MNPTDPFKTEHSRAVVISDLTVKAALAELPESLLVDIVMELTNGFHHPELVRQNIAAWKSGARRKSVDHASALERA